jgi:hypothetical protein
MEAMERVAGYWEIACLALIAAAIALVLLAVIFKRRAVAVAVAI